MTYKPSPVPNPPDSRYLRDELNRIGVELARTSPGGGTDPALEARVAQLESDVAALQAQVTQLETDVAALDARVTQIETDVAALDARITTLENRYPLTWDGVS